jgi:hypothetical protein
MQGCHDFPKTAMRARTPWGDLFNQRVQGCPNAFRIGIAQIEQAAEVIGVKALIAFLIKADCHSTAMPGGDRQSARSGPGQNRRDKFTSIHRSSHFMEKS